MTKRHSIVLSNVFYQLNEIHTFTNWIRTRLDNINENKLIIITNNNNDMVDKIAKVIFLLLMLLTIYNCFAFGITH